MREHANHRYAVAVVHSSGGWKCIRLERTALTGLDEAISAVREAWTGDADAVFGFFNADEEFFLIVRPTAGGTDLMLSDTRAAEQHTLAAQVLDVLRVNGPGKGVAGPSPAGALGILGDAGIGPADMAALLRAGALPDDQLRSLAEQAGFGAQFEDARR
ncbi:putative tRNA adenosine deaminase-associated protein [Streptomyces sp. Ag109_G2-6]|uniref:tRNA adenosine deaminase-associated protein n=1 Tax=Streptomyces TaxID=1883 RepID=UPI0009A51945|nr:MULTISPECIES: tRNA adenosine deaminase-associated protein [Streptomyces]RPF30010.1 putative tRNA adenosine deaminase-associated protein [Streptomyces sp. Ag109_G2-6]